MLPRLVLHSSNLRPPKSIQLPPRALQQTSKKRLLQNQTLLLVTQHLPTLKTRTSTPIKKYHQEKTKMVQTQMERKSSPPRTRQRRPHGIIRLVQLQILHQLKIFTNLRRPLTAQSTPRATVSQPKVNTPLMTRVHTSHLVLSVKAIVLLVPRLKTPPNVLQDKCMLL